MSSQEPELPAMAAVGSEDWSGWSSLPADLVRRIADRFLVTDDADCYMNLRAVCPSWRAAIDDPKDHASDVRFRPTCWIVLDEDSQTQSGKLLLLLNTTTGRFLRKKLPPLLDDYYIVDAAFGGFLVLADRDPPHAARLLNPLTGAVTRFSAPVPLDAGVADVFTCHPDNTVFSLLLLGDSSHTFYSASPDSQAFDSECYDQEPYEFFRKMVVGGAYPHIFGTAFFGAIAELQDLVRSLHADPAKFFSSGHSADDTRCFVLALATLMLLVVKTHGSLLVFKMDTKLGKLVPLQSMGTSFAIFVGHRRCVFVDANKFPGIEGNCVYYTEHQGSWAHICKYNIQDKKVERICEAAEFLKQDKRFDLVADRPFTIVQLLCSYTINRRDSELVAATKGTVL